MDHERLLTPGEVAKMFRVDPKTVSRWASAVDRDHVMTVTKSTCEDLMDAQIAKPGAETAAVIAEWCSDGTPTPDALEYRDRALDPGLTMTDLRELHAEVKARRMLGAAVIDDHGDDTTLGAMIVRLGQERRQTPTTPPVDMKVSEKQQRRMHALWNEIGMGGEQNRDARLSRTSGIVGRDIETSATLTAVEADAVIADLEAERRQMKAGAAA